MSLVALQQGPMDYSANELRIVAPAVGRTSGTRHSDGEPAAKALISAAAAEPGMGVQQSPGYNNRSQGSAGRWHRERWGFTRAYKLALQRNYSTETYADHPR